MKKLLLLFAVMLSTVGAWAQTDVIKASTSVECPEHVYTIKNGNNYFMYYSTGPASAKATAAYFAFYAGDKEGDYKIYCLTNKKWVSYTPSTADDVKSFASLSDSQEGVNAWNANLVADGKGNLTQVYEFKPYNTSGSTYASYMNWNGGINSTGYSTDSEEKTVGVWRQDAATDAGSAWILEEVVMPFIVSADYDNAHWYALNIRDDGPTYLYYNSALNYIKANEGDPNFTDQEKDKYLWAFIGNVVDGFKIVNKAAGKGYVLSSPNAPTGDKNADELPRMVSEGSLGSGNSVWKIEWATHANAATSTFNIVHPTATSYALNRQDYSGTKAVCYWTGRDMGSALQAVELLPYTGSSWQSFWSEAEVFPEKVSVSLGQSEGQNVYKHEVVVNLYDDGVTAKFRYKDGNKRIDILGMDIANSEGKLVASDYHFGYSGGNQSNKVYNLSGLEPGTYLLRLYVADENNGDLLSNTIGYIALSGIRYSEESEISEQFSSVKAGVTEEQSILSTLVGNTYGYYNSEDVEGISQAIEAVGETATTANIGKLVDALSQACVIVPQPGKFYRFKGKASGKYMTGEDTNGNALTSGNFLMAEYATETYDDASVFYLTAEGKLLNYRTGRFVDATHSVGAVGAAGNVISFLPSGGRNAGYLTLKSNASGVGTYLYDDNTILNRNSVYAAEKCDWLVEDVNWLPVPMNTEAGYATLYSPVQLNLNNRVKAYSVAINDNGVVADLTELSCVPANTGVVLQYVTGAETSNGCVFLPVEETTETGVSTALIGTYADTYISEESYVLSRVNGATGFYKAAFNISTDTTNDGTVEEPAPTYESFLNNGFKAYLPKPEETPEGARFLVFNFGDDNATAIEGIEAENTADAVVYDLAGRRVQKAQKGLYIVNGKKVIK